MKKRWAMGLLCCLLLFQLAFPAKAAGSVYFVAAEESVLPVTDATMPSGPTAICMYRPLYSPIWGSLSSTIPQKR